MRRHPGVRWDVIILPVVGINNRWYEIILFGWQMSPGFFFNKNGAVVRRFFIFLCRFYCLFSSTFAKEYKTDEISD